MTKTLSTLTDSKLDEALCELSTMHKELELERTRWLACRRALDAQFVSYLAELTKRVDHPAQYVKESLGLSQGVARKRLLAAKAATVKPEVVDHLESGRLTLSSLGELSEHIEVPGLLERALDMSRSQTATLVDEYREPRSELGKSRGAVRDSTGLVRSMSPILRCKLLDAAHLHAKKSKVEQVDAEAIVSDGLELLVCQLRSELDAVAEERADASPPSGPGGVETEETSARTSSDQGPGPIGDILREARRLAAKASEVATRPLRAAASRRTREQQRERHARHVGAVADTTAWQERGADSQASVNG